MLKPREIAELVDRYFSDSIIALLLLSCPVTSDLYDVQSWLGLVRREKLLNSITLCAFHCCFSQVPGCTECCLWAKIWRHASEGEGRTCWYCCICGSFATEGDFLWCLSILTLPAKPSGLVGKPPCVAMGMLKCKEICQGDAPRACVRLVILAHVCDKWSFCCSYALSLHLLSGVLAAKVVESEMSGWLYKGLKAMLTPHDE